MEKAKGYDGKYEIVIGEKVYYMDYIEELDALKLLLTYKKKKKKIGIKKMYDIPVIYTGLPGLGPGR